MSSLEAINARIKDNEKSVARAERYKKQADDEVKHYREALAEAETRHKASLERAKEASKELEDARLALKDAQKAIVSIDGDDEGTMAGVLQDDNNVVEMQLSFDSDDKSSGADGKSRRVSDAVPEKVLVEGCEQHEVNGMYQFDGFDDRGYPTYLKVKECGCEFYEIHQYFGCWCISHGEEESEDGVEYYSMCDLYRCVADNYQEDPVPWLFTTGWDSLHSEGKTALKVLPVD